MSPMRPLSSQLIAVRGSPTERREPWVVRAGLVRNPSALNKAQPNWRPLWSPFASISSALSSQVHADLEVVDESDKKRPQRPKKGKGTYDVILSSGFLAFAHHSGFLQAVDDAGLPVKAVMGTSAGALTGSLYAAGYTPREVAAILARDPPFKLLRFCWPWEGGLLSMQPVVDRLHEVLPPTFEELPTDFACGVCCRDGSHRVINSGPLPEAVVASAAIPVLFAPIRIPGQDGGPFSDGGKVDRVGLTQWRDFRRQHNEENGKKSAPLPPALVHLMGRSSPFSGNDTVQRDETQVMLVKSPKSGVSLLSLGDFPQQMAVVQKRAFEAMELHKKNRSNSGARV